MKGKSFTNHKKERITSIVNRFDSLPFTERNYRVTFIQSHKIIFLWIKSVSIKKELHFKILQYVNKRVTVPKEGGGTLKKRYFYPHYKYNVQSRLTKNKSRCFPESFITTEGRTLLSCFLILYFI